ncbi:MAG: hypothetical protein NVS1B13_26250 [Flavisolibacter sp.]
MKQFIYVLTLTLSLSLLSATFTAVQAQQRESKEVYKTKKPWSHRKKDAVIGAGAGAVTGAIVGHGAKGAVVGGVVGGGAGYLLGKHKDKIDPVPAHKTIYKRKDK